MCVKFSPIRIRKALLFGSELWDQMKNRRPRRRIITPTLWGNRWRETARRCLMCGWVTATSRAELTQPIIRRDSGASLQHQPTLSTNNWAQASPDRSPSPSIFFLFLFVSPSCQSGDGRIWILVSVAMWCHHELSSADLLESIFTLIWVALLGSHLTTIHLLTNWTCSNVL